MELVGPAPIARLGAGTRGGSAGDAHGPTAEPVVPIAAVTRPAVAVFEDVYAQHYRPLVRVAYLVLGSHESAEEVVQDVFVRAHLRWSRLDEPVGYLRVSVVNGCRDRLRRRGRL